MLAVLYGSEGVGVVFFSSLMFLRSYGLTTANDPHVHHENGPEAACLGARLHRICVAKLRTSSR
jgi:hypothetical protein